VAHLGEAKADIRLKKVKNLSAHLTNAEWMMSIPGTDEQKRFLLNCNGCHTLERIMKSSYDADGFLQIFERMANYYPGSTPLKPQRLAGTAVRDVQRGGDGRKTAEWLASINLSQQQTWSFPLKTQPRLTGKSTRVIITEYDLPSPLIQPHDVVLEAGYRSLEICQRAGVPVAYGSDLLGQLQEEQSREFLIRGEVMTPLEVIQSATTIAARVLRHEGKLGVIAPGAFADLLVVDGNPLESLKLFQDQGAHLSVIMKGGRFHKNRLA